MAQSEDYVLACYRYIELNPVRADMVNHPREYPWSSYKTNAEGKKSELIIPHDQYMQLDHRGLERRKAYRALFKAHTEQPIDNEIRAATNGNYVLGNTKFQEQIAQALGRRVTRGKAGRPKREGDAHSPILLGRNVDEMLHMVDALQFTEEHGEVCPAGWQEGDKGMTASPDGVAAYLAGNADKL